MFRRKEEGLFDTDTDQNQMLEESSHDEGTSQAPSAGFSASTQAASSASQQPAAQSSARQTTAAPSANSFRPSTAAPAPVTADLNRSRPSEAKPAVASTSAMSNFSSSSASSLLNDKSKAGQRVLTVGNDILLKGEIATCDRLVIEGKVDAILNDVHTVEIAECGSFKGSAQIEDAEISGLFEGDLTVRGRLVIYATGKVRGKISYGEIEIERGGELSGEIKMVSAAATSGLSSRPVARNVTKEDKVAA